MATIEVNGRTQEIDVAPDVPLLWVLRDHLNLTGTKYGCGMALCGACTVHVNGEPVRSCVTAVSAVAGKAITTIEAVGATRMRPCCVSFQVCLSRPKTFTKLPTLHQRRLAMHERKPPPPRPEPSRTLRPEPRQVPNESPRPHTVVPSAPIPDRDSPPPPPTQKDRG